MTPLDAVVIGLFQAISIFPGISRSGATISGGLLRNFKREDAARVSFLMAIPIMLAAGLLAMLGFCLPSRRWPASYPSCSQALLWPPSWVILPSAGLWAFCAKRISILLLFIV